MFGTEQVKKAYSWFKEWELMLVGHRDGSETKEYCLRDDGTRLKKLAKNTAEYERGKNLIDFAHRWARAAFGKEGYGPENIQPKDLAETAPLMNEIERQILNSRGTLKPENFNQIKQFAIQHDINYDNFRKEFFDTREGCKALMTAIGSRNNINIANMYRGDNGSIHFTMSQTDPGKSK